MFYEVQPADNREQYKRMKLSSVVKDCAKQIIDIIYDHDGMAKLRGYFVNGKNIKINTEPFAIEGNSLRYVFIRQDSTMYSGNTENKTRVFLEREYTFDLQNEVVTCRLCTEWKYTRIGEGGDGNCLGALIAVVNHCYSNCFQIKEENGDLNMYLLQKDFMYNILPSAFQNEFAFRYIKSLLTKPFVILTGNSGTGKTRITKQLAEYFEQEDSKQEKNWLVVPVGADWTDNTKILGFNNPLADECRGKYIKSNILKLMERANNNADIPFFLILDEMNLSHVERYFSDFLSHMEIPDSSFQIEGYGTIAFPENLFVVGTVNIDETTYMFSPKVLDRANVIEFKPEREKVMDLFMVSVEADRVNPCNDESKRAFLKLAKDIRQGKCKLSDSDLRMVQKIFDSIYIELERCGFEFAYRTVKEIRQYISVSAELQNEFGNTQLLEAIDEQVLQKILPKIHGNKKEIGNLLAKLAEICDINGLSRSKGKIERMKGRLEVAQYASFI